MDKYITHKKKALDRRTCDHIINIFEQSNSEWNHRDYWALYPLLTEVRFSFLKPILLKHINGYGDKHKFLGIRRGEWRINDLFHIQKYEPGHYYDSTHDDGTRRDVAKYLGHHEHGWTEYDSIRLIAWMVYLNDIKKDGGTCWPQQNFTAKPRAGDMYLWPAGWTHSHYGIPAPNEEKYILTGWCSYDTAHLGGYKYAPGASAVENHNKDLYTNG